MPNSRGLLALLRKEIVTAVTNQVYVLLFGVPVVIATFLGLSFSPDRQAAAPVAVVLPSPRESADRIDQALAALPTLRRVGTYPDAGSAVAAAREGRAVAVVDFSAATFGSTGLAGSVVVTLDETRPVLAEVVRSTLQAWIAQSGPAPPVRLQTSLLRGVDPRDSSIPFWLLMAVLAVSTGSAPLLVTEEKEHRTLDALLVSPVGVTTIVLAKGILGTATILVMCGLIVGLNRTAVAEPGLLIAALVVGAASMVCLGLLIGTLAPNQASAAPVASVVLLLLFVPVILSQIESTPVIGVAQILPTYHLNKVVTAAVVGGASILDAAGRLAYVAAFGIASGILATWFMDRGGRS